MKYKKIKYNKYHICLFRKNDFTEGRIEAENQLEAINDFLKPFDLAISIKKIKNKK